MTAQRMLPAMDIHHPNAEHSSQYRLSKQRFPNDDSNDAFELFVCPYDYNHKISSKQWRTHLRKCSNNFGGCFKTCMFNASHRIADPEYEWHLRICPDRDVNALHNGEAQLFERENDSMDYKDVYAVSVIPHSVKFVIAKEAQAALGQWKLATSVDHRAVHAGHNDNDECWDDEVDDSRAEFSLDPAKGMPLSIIPSAMESDEFIDGPNEEPYVNDGSSVLNEDLLPERPANWTSMTKTQQKNYKRKYDRQQQRMLKENVSEEDFQPVSDPTLWSQNEREAKLNAIKACYPLANEKQFAKRCDFTSLLNIVCQKVRWNLPEYRECSSTHGGFACQCRVGLQWFNGREFCSTKKDAKHNAAKWALLELDIPWLDGSKNTQTKPTRPMDISEKIKLREADELGKLMASTGGRPRRHISPQKQVQPQSQPIATVEDSKIQSLTSQHENLSIVNDKEFPALGNGHVNNVLKMANSKRIPHGRGRGTVLKQS